MSDFVIRINFEVTEVSHTGYCSDVEVEDAITKLVYRKTETDDDPCPIFVKNYCNKNGKVDEYGLERLSREERHHSDCGCGLNKIIWKATSARLIKVNNIRAEFLGEDYSSGEE